MSDTDKDAQSTTNGTDSLFVNRN
ncbi:uncharacterized protein METZ01_LOCUS17062 [marine metagenome]|uniref:Uncharacterized protein n=1 Tax=marine metagenome TaxID=408172 RepID=A0A381PD35_9ZZZZ